MHDKISLIIPVYNVERFIVECFESVLAQTHQNFEVIAVDDGATDKSGEICDQYSQKDQRFITIHTPNRGIGNARNLALDRMTGDYCFFLDPDDVLEIYSLDLLLTSLEENQADIALGISANFSGNYKDVTHSEQCKIRLYDSTDSIVREVLLDKRDLKPLGQKHIPMKVNWEFFSTLYKVDFIRKHDIRFLDISYGEDTYFCLKYLLLSQRAVTVDRPVYWHRRNTTSTSFQYHENYLEETQKYYTAYLDLFRILGGPYLEQAKLGLDGQYFNRCISAIDREFCLGIKIRSFRQVYDTYRKIGLDGHFLSQYPKGIVNVNGRYPRFLARFIRHRLCWLATLFTKLHSIVR